MPLSLASLAPSTPTKAATVAHRDSPFLNCVFETGPGLCLVSEAGEVWDSSEHEAEGQRPHGETGETTDATGDTYGKVLCARTPVHPHL